MKKICIVIPCYNEATRMPVGKIRSFISDNPDVLLLLVDDGSTDGTRKIIDNLSADFLAITSLFLLKNSGKAEAVRQGVLKAFEYDVDLIAYLDADMATPPEEVLYLRESMEQKKDLVFVFGSRIKTLSNTIERKVRRHLFGRVFATFASKSLKLPVYDTQCGCKLFTKELAVPLFERPFISRWMFDVELFWRLIKLYGRDKMPEITQEVPLRTWVDAGESKIKITDTFKLPFEFWKIHRFYKK